MSVIQELPRSRERFEPFQVLRWLLVAVITLGTLFVWWATPRESGVDQLGIDLQHGRVHTLQIGCTPEGGDGLIGFTTVSRPDFFHEQQGPMLCWTTTWGRAYAADAEDLDQQLRFAVKRHLGGGYGPDLFTQSIQRSAADLDPSDGPRIAYGGDGTVGPRGIVAGGVALTVLALFVLMLCGQQPRRGTRWGVFWAMTACSGLGTIWYLLREQPWNAEALRWPEPEAHATRVPREDGTMRNRFGGWTGFVMALVTTLGIALAVSLFGLPGRGGIQGGDDGSSPSSVTWTVVGHDGRTSTVTYLR